MKGKRREVIIVDEYHNLTCLCHDCKKFDYEMYMEINCNATVKDYDCVKGIGVVNCKKFEANKNSLL